MRNAKWLNDMKLRVSVGQTGNAQIGNSEYLALYGTTTNDMGNGVINTVYPSQIANSKLGWEKTPRSTEVSMPTSGMASSESMLISITQRLPTCFRCSGIFSVRSHDFQHEHRINAEQGCRNNIDLTQDLR